MIREHTCLNQARVAAERIDVVDGPAHRQVQSGRRFIRQDIITDMPPQTIHDIQFGAGGRQPAQARVVVEEAWPLPADVVALFLPFACTKEPQTSAPSGTKRRLGPGGPRTTRVRSPFAHVR